MDPDEVLPRLHVHLPPVQWCVIAQEHHQDEGLHLHVAVFFEKALRVRDLSIFDACTGQHGNYQAMRSVAATLRYIHKEDSTPLTWGSVPEFSTGSPQQPKRTKVSDDIASRVCSGDSLADINATHPGYVMMNKKRIEEYIVWQQTLASAAMKQPLTSISYAGTCPQTQACVTWLSSNLLQQRSFKQLQLWLSGPPNSRKSTLLRTLETYFATYWTPNSELFYDLFSDDETDLIVMDEFRQGKPCEWLNLWLEGSTMLVRRKGQAGVVKRRNQPVIICSNYDPIQLYGDPVDLACIQARVQVITLTGPLDTDNIVYA